MAFNSLMIVANADGLVSYNIEDGNEVSRIAGVSADGVGVSYFGFGPQAIGVAAFYNADYNAFEFHGIDNISRSFTPVEGGPSMRDNVRGFCFGRASANSEPTLFVVQPGKVAVFNITAASFELGSPIPVVLDTAEISTPDDITDCAVTPDGVLLVLAENGDVFRVDGSDFDAALVQSSVNDSGGLAYISVARDEASGDGNGHIAILDRTDGAIHVFNGADGVPQGVIKVAATQDIEAVDNASVMGATSVNLGGLYRNGVIALGLDTEAPSVRLVPTSGIFNSLSFPGGDPVNLRGAAPAAEDNDALIINPEFNNE